jgi:hypothetical protein
MLYLQVNRHQAEKIIKEVKYYIEIDNAGCYIRLSAAPIFFPVLSWFSEYLRVPT